MLSIYANVLMITIYNSDIKDNGKNFEENISYKNKDDCGNYCCVANAYDTFVFKSFCDNASLQNIARKMQNPNYATCEALYPVE